MVSSVFIWHSRLVVLCVIEKENLERLKAADPAVVAVRDMANESPLIDAVLKTAPAIEVEVVICYEEDVKKLSEFTNPEEMMKYLLRGYKDLPGDELPMMSTKTEGVRRA